MEKYISNEVHNIFLIYTINEMLTKVSSDLTNFVMLIIYSE